jgi:hypothetical protein
MKRSIWIAIVISLSLIAVALYLSNKESRLDKYDNCVRVETNIYTDRVKVFNLFCDYNGKHFNRETCTKHLEQRQQKILEIKEECSWKYLR